MLKKLRIWWRSLALQTLDDEEQAVFEKEICSEPFTVEFKTPIIIPEKPLWRKRMQDISDYLKKMI